MTTHLFVIAGQSLAMGYNLTTADLPAGYATTSAAQLWTTAGWTTLNPGVNTGIPNSPGAWGPEMEFARQWTADHPGDTAYFVKQTQGSTGLDQDPTQPDWSPASPEQFAKATLQVTNALATLSGAVEVTVLWDQGQQDAAYATKAANYATNLSNLFTHMASDWSAYTILYNQINTQLAYDGQVRDAQSGGIITDGYHLQADNLHLTGLGEQASGANFYASYNQTVTTETGTAGADIMAGSTGSDSLYGAAGADMLFGGPGGDWLQGNQGSDTIHGGAGNDTLYGGQDNDWLAGDGGSNTLVGGLGADTFYFRGDGTDTVSDFAAGVDHLQIGYGQTYSAAQVGLDTVVTVDLHTITLTGVSLAGLGAGWIL